MKNKKGKETANVKIIGLAVLAVSLVILSAGIIQAYPLSEAEIASTGNDGMPEVEPEEYLGKVSPEKAPEEVKDDKEPNKPLGLYRI